MWVLSCDFFLGARGDEVEMVSRGREERALRHVFTSSTVGNSSVQNRQRQTMALLELEAVSL